MECTTWGDRSIYLPQLALGRRVGRQLLRLEDTHLKVKQCALGDREVRKRVERPILEIALQIVLSSATHPRATPKQVLRHDGEEAHGEGDAVDKGEGDAVDKGVCVWTRARVCACLCARVPRVRETMAKLLGGSVYHYHTMDYAPYTMGCYGPVASKEECMALYPDTCYEDPITVETADGDIDYVADCPCWDAPTVVGERDHFTLNNGHYNAAKGRIPLVDADNLKRLSGEKKRVRV